MSGTGRFIGLLDAEAEHRRDPHSFSIPRSELRAHLVPGSLVKLLFAFRDGNGESAERMWVEVQEVRGNRYVGRLDNEPDVIAELDLNDRWEFGPEHVAALWREMPASPQPGEFAIVSSRVWRDGASPARAVRSPPFDNQFSGWVVFAEKDPSTPPDDLSGFEPVTHYELTHRFRSIDSIEDEVPETEWRWDESALEWKRER